MDMDTADLQITGFGERKLNFGDGPATKRCVVDGAGESACLSASLAKRACPLDECRVLSACRSSTGPSSSFFHPARPPGSPAAPTRYLGVEFPTEDDVLHCDSLPTFNNTLSREEAEQLMSYLTVAYVRVPLILGFFASRDRVTYLFNPGLQSLLRGVLFEGAKCAVLPASVCS